MTAHRRPHSRLALIGILALSLLGAALLAGCGGSSSSASQSSSGAPAVPENKAALPGTGPTKAAHKTPAMSNPDVGQASPQTGRDAKSKASLPTRSSGSGSSAAPTHKTLPARSDKVGKAGETQRARHPAGDNEKVGTPRALNPCTLVSVPQAQSFTGGAVSAAIEAPLGPTCVYRSSGNSKTQITLALQANNATQLTKHLARREEMTVSGHRAYCGHLGTQLLVVPLANGQMLSVTAPCAVARQFATAALSRLEA
jgi:hypothetical protein